MKTVVITGSARGLGFELAKNFGKNAFNVILSDINEQNLAKTAARFMTAGFRKCDFFSK